MAKSKLRRQVPQPVRTRILIAIVYAIVTAAGNACADAAESTHAASSPTNTTPAPTCGAPLPIEQLIEQFATRWNEHQAAELDQLFTSGGELDMSSPSQGMQYGQEQNEWHAYTGQAQIEQFAKSEWTLGEHLAYSTVDEFKGGSYAVGMRATFSDGSVQELNDAKFVLGDCPATLLHVVLVADHPAH